MADVSVQFRGLGGIYGNGFCQRFRNRDIDGLGHCELSEKQACFCPRKTDEAVNCLFVDVGWTWLGDRDVFRA